MTENKLEVDRGVLTDVMGLALDQGARYADIRVQTGSTEAVQAEKGVVKNVSRDAQTTVGVRALAGGTWGFASMDVADEDGLKGVLDVCVERAVRNAKAQSDFPEIRLAEVDPVQEHVGPGVVKEPISLDEKISLAVDMTGEAMDVEHIVMALAGIYHADTTSHFASTEGALITQDFMRVGGSILCNASTEKDSQTYYRPFGSLGGWEFIEDIDPLEVTRKVADLTRRLVTEATVPESRLTTVVTKPSFNMLKVHEIVGHPVEGDRVLGGESAWAGRAWWKDRQGQEVASELITAVSDARPTERHRGFYGTFAFDDEGVPSQRIVHIENGVLKDFLHSRQTARVAGVAPSGAMRANHAGLMPIIRMTNTYFEHDKEGPNTLEECIEDVKEGVVMGRQSIPSIDSRRYRFQISSFEAWKVERGEITGMLKNTAMMGTTPEYLRSVYRVGGPGTWELFQVPNCGKGDPMQIMRVGNGGPVMVGRARIIGGA